MFESLKKRFSETNSKLTEKLKKEATEENNIEETEEVEEVETKEKSEKSFYNQFSNASDEEEEGEEAEVSEDDEDEEELDLKQDSEETEDEVEEDSETKKDEEEEEKSGGFFSRFRGKDKEEESVEEDTADDDEEESEDESIEEEEEIKAIESEEEESEPEEEEEEKSGGFFSSLRRGSKDKDDDEEDEEKSGGFFSFIKEKTLSEDDVDDILFDLEMSLLEGDVAMDVADKVVNSVKEDLVGKKIKRSNDIEEYTYNALKSAVSEIINIEGKSMTDMIEDKKKVGEPLVVMLVGINGTGKTTTIGKLCDFYIKKGYTPVIAASDTFRAGAIEQVKHHADNLGVKIIKHEKGSDPAAVAFDAVSHAKATGKELVLIDTAGRMQNNTNLMDEMKKIKRVSKPDLVVFVGDALTGNDATLQASKFNDAIDIDGVILTKADADSKGGASLSIGYVIKKPILFLGMGQEYSDIIEYDPDWMLNQLFG